MSAARGVKRIISVVIVNFNGIRFLHECLSSVLLQTYQDCEIILVDNGSVDGSAEYVRDHFPGVRILQSEKNLGFAAGSNLGIRAASGEYLFMLNNDTRVDARCIEHLVRAMDADPGVGACASKMVFPDGRINSAGIAISRSGAAWDRGISEPDTGQYDREEEVFGACAGAALYRRKMLDAVGLFDEDFFMYMEDVDLAFRSRLAGWKCIYVPEAVVYHHHGGTAGVGTPLSVYYGNRNIIWYVVKNYPRAILFSSLPWIAGRNLIMIPYYVMQGKGWTIIRSKLDAFRGLPMAIRKRRDIRQSVQNDEVMRFIHTWSGSGRPKNDVAGPV